MGFMADLWVRRPDADLAYEERGAGATVGYAHGILLSRAAEDAMDLYDWAPLTRQRRLVRYDARAHGASTGRAVAQDYVWPHLADDLLALVDRVDGGEPVDWMGASMGCGSLLWAATKAPDRFRRLVLMIPPTTGETRAAAAGMYRSGADLIESEGMASWLALLQQSPMPPIFADLPDYSFNVAVTEALLPSVLRGAAITDLPDHGGLAALPHPTLILAWETDPIHPVTSAELLAKTLPNARLHVSVTTKDVRTWAERIAAFLAE